MPDETQTSAPSGSAPSPDPEKKQAPADVQVGDRPSEEELIESLIERGFRKVRGAWRR